MISMSSKGRSGDDSSSSPQLQEEEFQPQYEIVIKAEQNGALVCSSTNLPHTVHTVQVQSTYERVNHQHDGDVEGESVILSTDCNVTHTTLDEEDGSEALALEVVAEELTLDGGFSPDDFTSGRDVKEEMLMDECEECDGLQEQRRASVNARMGAATRRKKIVGGMKKKSYAQRPHPTFKLKKQLMNDTSDTIGENRKRFCHSWLSIPEFQCWLAEAGVPDSAYCKFCQKTLKAGKSELYKHLYTRKHGRKAAAYGTGLPDDPVTKVGVYLADDCSGPCSKEVLDAMESARGVPSMLVEGHRNTAELEARAARLLGKEDAMFVLTGTIANTLAVLAHCSMAPCSLGSVVLAGDRSHLYRCCQTTLTQMRSINMRALRNQDDGTILLHDVRDLMAEYQHQQQPRYEHQQQEQRKQGQEEIGYQQNEHNESVYRQEEHQDQQQQRNGQWVMLHRPTLLCLENTHMYNGGQVISLQYMTEVGALCAELGLQLHLDGARLLLAACATGVSPAELADAAASVAVCFNKVLDAPNGSVVAGTKQFVTRCRLLAPVFGVGAVRTEALAAAGLQALRRYTHHCARALQYARNMDRVLSRLSSSAVLLVVLGNATSNVLLLECDNTRVTPQHLVNRLMEVPPAEVASLGERVTVRACVHSHNSVRLVTHATLTSELVAAAAKKIKYVIKEYEAYLVLEYNIVSE